MNCAIVTIGNEIVQGFILNTNAQYFGQKLTEHGFQVKEVISILDDEKQIVYTFKRIKDQYQLVIVSGGLGPTDDDKTKEAIAKALDLKLEINEHELEKIKQYFAIKNIVYHPMNDKQALYSSLDNILINNNGTANGYYFTIDQTTYCVLPGPPRENRKMFDEFLTTLANDEFYEKNLFLSEVNETKAESLVQHLYLEYQDVYIGCYLQPHGLVYRFSSSNKSSLEKCFEQAKTIFKDYIICEDFDLINSFVKYLINHNISISFAESCTAGLACSLIGGIDNVSQVLSESFVTYSYKAKEMYLGVKRETLEFYGAVSSKCALEMALGLSKKTNSKLNISITGYASPNSEKHGQLFIGVSYQGHVDIKEYYYPIPRNDFRLKAAYLAIIQAYRLIQNV